MAALVARESLVSAQTKKRPPACANGRFEDHTGQSRIEGNDYASVASVAVSGDASGVAVSSAASGVAASTAASAGAASAAAVSVAASTEPSVTALSAPPSD